MTNKYEKISLLGFFALLIVQAETEDKEKTVLANFIDECNDPKATKFHIQKNIETLLYAKVITERIPDSNIFLRVCEDQALTFCTQCSSMCSIAQHCSMNGMTNCRTNCISNQVNLLLSSQCCSIYCKTECPLRTQIAFTDRVRRAGAPQLSVTTFPTPSHLISESDGRIWLLGLLALFLILPTIIMLLRKRKSSSSPRLSNQETGPTERITDLTETHSTETDFNDADSTETEELLLAAKFVGQWDNSDEEVFENFPKPPLDAVLSSNKSKLPAKLAKIPVE